jgi:hypothetical protein
MKQVRERRFSDPAKAERCKRNPELASGEIRIEVLMDPGQDTATPTVFLFYGFNTGLPELYESEFRGDKKAVQDNEEKRDDDE